MVVIDRLRKEGADIPSCVKCVVKVLKIFNYKEMSKEFDFEESLVNSVELVNSCLILDGEEIIGILVLNGISDDEASSLGSRASRLWGSGGYVERSPDKLSGLMAMFGWRFAAKLGR